MSLFLSLALLASAFVLYLLSLFRIPSYRTYKLAQKISGPNKFWILGEAINFAQKNEKTLLPYIKKIVEREPSGIVRLWILGIPLVIIVDPIFIKATLGSSMHLKKGFEYGALKDGIGNGLVIADLSIWRERRKLLNPLFNHKIIDNKLLKINKQARNLVEALMAHESKPVDIFACTSLSSIQLVCELLAAVELDDVQAIKEFQKSFDFLSNYCTNKAIGFHIKDWMYRFLEKGKSSKIHRRVLDNFAKRIIQERKLQDDYNNIDDGEEGEGRKKLFLDTLLKSNKKNVYVTESDIRDELLTFIIAGNDSTAVTTHFVLFHLALDKEIQEKAYEEQYAIFGDSDRNTTEEDIQNMPYLTKVIQECLRLYPPLPYLSRELEDDVVCGETTIPKGANVVTAPYIIHRQESLYPDPEKFDPERFSPEEIAKRHPCAYIPFGAGPRYCIGQNLAMVNLKVILSAVIRKFKMEKVTERGDFELEILIFLSVNKPIFIKFLPRN